MNSPKDIILEMLDEDIDIVDRGFFLQTIHNAEPDVYSWPTMEKEVLRELLDSGEVDVGHVDWVKQNCYEFIAWKGTVDERIDRTIEATANADDGDKRFAYWLCLRCKVHRFEVD